MGIDPNCSLDEAERAQVGVRTPDGSGIQALRRLLKDQEALSEQQRAEVVKLVWLLGQVPRNVRVAALAKLDPILKSLRLGRHRFYDEMHALVDALEHVHRTIEDFCAPERPKS